MFVDKNQQRISGDTLVRVYGGTGVVDGKQASSALGDTLTVAFSRLPEASQNDQARGLLAERLGLLHRTLALLSLSFFVLERTVSFALGERGAAQVFAGESALIHLGATALFAGAWLACRRLRLPTGVLQAIDVALPIASGTAFALMMRLAPGGAPLIPVLCAMATLLARANLVPSSPRLTFVISSLGCLPAVISAALSGDGGLGAPNVPAAFYVSLWAGVIVGLSTLTSRTMYGLEQKVQQARQLGQYTLVERIGAGGMGVVYRAEHALLRRPTAVKVLPPERMGEQSLSRFEREVQLTSRLTHPNTVAVYDFGRTPDGLFYYAMEYLEGLTLSRLVELSGPLPPARAAYIMRQVAGSLAEAHAIGLVHRDIKPDNILLCDRGGTCDFAKVLDFGLVKDVTSGDASLSNVDLIIGTPSYLSPEAITQPSRVAFPRDLYAIGAVLYFLITGREVFQGRTTLEICTHHVRTPPEPPSRVLGRPVPEALERLILACLAKNPDERPASASVLEHALREIVGNDWGQAQAKLWWDSHRERIRSVPPSEPPPGSSTELVQPLHLAPP